MTKRVMLVVAYDGTNYQGWQVQPSGNTIEDELNRHLSALFMENIKVIGASRTDSGVHALGNLAVFDTSARMPAEKIAYALNQRLPEDIRIQQSVEVATDFHPRHIDTRKTYEYRITCGEFPIPTKRLYSFFTYHQLDMNSMKQAATYLIGEHDFKSFCSTAAVVETTVRTIYDISVTKQQEDIVIQVTGNGFLYNMVRIIAGTLMEVGKGKIQPAQMKDILEAKDRTAAGSTAVARGLTLVKYEIL